MNKENTTLIPLESVTAVDLFEGKDDKKLFTLVSKVEHEAKALVKDLDVANEDDRKEIASVAYKVARSKTTIDDAGKEHAADLKNKIKLIDSRRKLARDTLDEIKLEIRKPVDEWEAAEAERIQKHTDNIAEIRGAGNTTVERYLELPLEAMEDRLKEIEATDPSTFEEFAENAEETRLACMAKMQTAIEKRKQHDKDQAELAELRAAREEQERKDAEAKAKEERKAREAQVAAAAAAEAEKQAELAKQREEVATAAASAAEARAAQAEANAKAELEAEQEAERKAAEEAQAARERNTRHKGEINSAAAEALMTKAGLDAKQARKVVTAIAKGQIPAVEIKY